MTLVSRFLISFGSALVTVILFTSPKAEARYRVGPGSGCQALSFPDVLSFAIDCPVPTGTEFASSTINGTEVDFYTSGGSTQTEVKACRQTWNSNSINCSNYTTSTFSGASSLYPATAVFSGGGSDDYRYYHIETNGTNVLGTYTTNSDT